MTNKVLTVMVLALTVFPWCGESSAQLLRFRDRANQRANDPSNESSNRRNSDPPQNRSNSNTPRYAAPPRMSTSASRLPAYVEDSLPQPVARELDTLPSPSQNERAVGNRPPGLELIEPIDAETYGLASDVIRGKAVELLEQLTADLAAAASDPRVQERLDLLMERIERGETIVEDDLDKLRSAAIESGLLPAGVGGRVPAAVERRLNRTLGTLVGLSAANQVFGAPFQPGAATPGLPSGAVNVVTCPPLRAGQMLRLPGGDLLAGTGGMANFGVEQIDAAQLLGVPLGIGEPAPDRSLNTSSAVRSGILMVNPPENGGPANFVAANRSYRLDAGYRQHLTENELLIQFTRGRGNQQGRYTLTDGTYVFRTSDQGWDLLKKSFRLAIDNRANEATFHYSLDNIRQQAAAGQLTMHRSKFPMVVRFDRGGGNETTKEIVQFESSLVVAVNPRDGLWDLYAQASYPEILDGPTSTPTNSLAREALLQERNRLTGLGVSPSFNAMKPVFNAAPAGGSWDSDRSATDPESLPSYLTEEDDPDNLLPEPAAE